MGVCAAGRKVGLRALVFLDYIMGLPQQRIAVVSHRSEVSIFHPSICLPACARLCFPASLPALPLPACPPPSLAVSSVLSLALGARLISAPLFLRLCRSLLFPLAVSLALPALGAAAYAPPPPFPFLPPSLISQG